MFPVSENEEGETGGRGVEGLEPIALQRMLWEAAVDQSLTEFAGGTADIGRTYQTE